MKKILLSLLMLCSISVVAQNAPLTVSVTESSGGFNNEGPDKAVDGITTNKWCGNNKYGNPYMVLKNEGKAKLFSYSLYTGNDIVHDGKNRNPKEWKLYAKEEECSHWIEISHVTDAQLPTDSSTRSQDYIIAEEYRSTFFRSFKFEIIQIEDGDIFEVGELSLNGMPCSHNYDENGICTNCGDGKNTGHNYVNGICTNCEEYEPVMGDGSEGSPYLIGNAGQLAWFGKQARSGRSSINAKLTADIDMAAICSPAIGGWIPITEYYGTFDGDNHALSNLYINNVDDIDAGLFRINFGVIKNLGIESGHVIAHQTRAGAICGSNFDTNDGRVGKIINCYNKATVESLYAGTNYADAGGICGWNVDGIIEKCYNMGDVICKTNPNVGGICGWSASGTITDCYNTGNVTALYTAGGICGLLTIDENKHPDGTSTISNCYNTGEINVCTTYGAQGSICADFPGNATLINNYYLKKYNYPTDAYGIAMTAEQFERGDVTWLLNNGVTDGTQAWYQALGTDSFPVLIKGNDNTVYADDNLKCDGTPDGTKLYGNTPVQGSREAHSYDNDNRAEDPDEGTTCLYSYICDKCHSADGDKKVIRTAEEPYWYVVLVKQDGKWIAPDEDDLRLVDDCALNVPIEFTPVSVRLMRSFSADGWYSLCLPFDVTDISMFAQVAEFSCIEGDTYKFTTVSAIEAGKAYIVRVDNDIDYPMFYGVTLKTGEPDNDGAFVGVYSPTELGAGCKVIGSGTTVNPANQGTMKGFRAYFPASAASAKAMRFTVDDGETTSISRLDADSDSDVLYNLQGQRVNASHKGIVIKKGKKTIQ